MPEKPLTMLDDLPPELKAAMKRMRDNLVIIFVKRNGGRVEVPIIEVDEADDLLMIETDPEKGIFILTTTPRQ